jgi:hypothetical protein
LVALKSKKKHKKIARWRFTYKIAIQAENMVFKNTRDFVAFCYNSSVLSPNTGVVERGWSNDTVTEASVLSPNAGVVG